MNTLKKIVGNDLAKLISSFNNPMETDGEYMFFRGCAIQIVTKYMNKCWGGVDLHGWMFRAVKEEWFPRLATDMEMLGYSVFCEEFREHRFLHIKWTKPSLGSSSDYKAFCKDLSSDFDDSER